MAKRRSRGTRRGDHEGSIFQRSDGRWVASATIGYDEEGKIIRKHIYGRSRIDVAEKLAEITNRISSDTFEFVDKTLFKEMMHEWLMVFKKNQVSPRTFEGNIRHFRKYIEPKIGNMKINEINSISIQKLLNDMMNKGLGIDYIRKCRFLLRQFFEYAVDSKLLSENPVNKTSVSATDRSKKDNKREYKALSAEAREVFVKKLEKHKFLKPLCFSMMFAGLRIGESLTLTWSDLDFDNKMLNINRGLILVPKFDKEGNIISRKTVVGETKTVASIREVPLPEILIKAFIEYKERQESKEVTSGVKLTEPDNYVFATNDGNVRTYYGTKAILERFLKKHNLEEYNIHFHALRHTYSTMLFEANQNPKLIQTLLGHRDVKTTLSTYNSIDKTYFHKARDVINREYEKKSEIASDDILDDLSDEQIKTLLKRIKERDAKMQKKEESEM